MVAPRTGSEAMATTRPRRCATHAAAAAQDNWRALRASPVPCSMPRHGRADRASAWRIYACIHQCMLCSALHIRAPRAHAYAYAYTFMHGRTNARHTGASCLVLSSLEGASRQRRRRHLAFLNPFSHMHQIHIHFYAKTPTLARSPARVRAPDPPVCLAGSALSTERLRLRR